MTRVRDWAGARVWTSLAIGLLSLACGSQQGKSSKAAEAQTPEQIEALFSREKELPAAREAKGPDGAWTAQFPSDSAVLVTAGEGHSQAEFSLGTEAKTRCVFYQEPVDAGHAIGIVLAGLREKATLEQVAPYRVTTVQGVPVVFLEGRYTVAAASGKQVGSLKLAISPRWETPVLCFLDEPGYVEAFTSAVTGVLTTLKVKEAPTAIAYAEVWAISIDGLAHGYQWLQMIDEGQGKRTTVGMTATFLPVGPGELMTTDDVDVIKSDASGILEGTFTKVESGEAAHELTLSRSGKSKYTVTGKVQGKDFKSQFTAQNLPDAVATNRLLAQNHRKNAKLKRAEFAPSLDPSAPTQVSYAIDSKAHSVTVQMGEMALLGTLTEDGLMSQVTMESGGHQIKLEVIHRAGKF